MATIQKDRILEFRGQDLHDTDGDKIGSIEEIYLDAETNEPEWALVNTGLFGTKRNFVPLRDASESDGSLRVPFGKDQVKDAPTVDANGQLTQRRGGRALLALRARVLRVALGLRPARGLGRQRRRSRHRSRRGHHRALRPRRRRPRPAVATATPARWAATSPARRPTMP